MWRELFSAEECVVAETKSLSRYIRAKEEPMLKEVRGGNILSEEQTKEEYQNKMHDDWSKGSQRRVCMANLGKVPKQSNSRQKIMGMAKDGIYVKENRSHHNSCSRPSLTNKLEQACHW